MKTSILRNGHLWTAHTIGVNGEGHENESKVRWYEIDLDGWPGMGSTPAVVQYGEIDPGEYVSACYPALRVDNNGNMAIAWNQCSEDEYVSIYRAIRRHADSSGTLRAALLLKAGTVGPQSGPFISDYATMDENPGEPGVMRTHHIYYETERRTWLGRIDVNRSLTNDLTGPNNPPQREDYVTLTVHGAEPGATVKWYYSLYGCTQPTEIAGLSVNVDIANAVYLAQATADTDGTAVKNFTIPVDFPLGDVWIQAGEYQNTSEVIATEVLE
jgi:hypothetical protein